MSSWRALNSSNQTEITFWMTFLVIYVWDWVSAYEEIALTGTVSFLLNDSSFLIDFDFSSCRDPLMKTWNTRSTINIMIEYIKYDTKSIMTLNYNDRVSIGKCS